MIQCKGMCLKVTGEALAQNTVMVIALNSSGWRLLRISAGLCVAEGMCICSGRGSGRVCVRFAPFERAQRGEKGGGRGDQSTVRVNGVRSCDTKMREKERISRTCSPHQHSPSFHWLSSVVGTTIRVDGELWCGCFESGAGVSKTGVRALASVRLSPLESFSFSPLCCGVENAQMFLLTVKWS